MAVIRASTLGELVNGTEFDDQIFGSSGSDTLNPGQGYDRVFGEAGDDVFLVSDRWDVLFESSGNDTALVSIDFVKPAEGIEQWILIDSARALPYWIDALVAEEALFAQKWLGPNRTFAYHFASTPLNYFSANDRKGWEPFTEAQKSLTRQAFSYLESLLDLRFVETTDPYQPNVIVLSNNSQIDTAGYAYLPSDVSSGSDVFLSATPANRKPGEWTYAALTLIHELGHAIGLKHPFENTNSTAAVPPVLSKEEDRTFWTVMSYTDQAVGYALKLATFDIAALQYLYGPSKQPQEFDNNYFLNPNGSNFIWDSEGSDSIDAGSISDPVFLSLHDGDWSWIKAKAERISAPGQITINIGTSIESARLGSGSDTVLGNQEANRLSLGAGNDWAFGLEGDDIIIGAAGDDMIDGGLGRDRAVFEKSRDTYRVERLFDLQHVEQFESLLLSLPGSTASSVGSTTAAAAEIEKTPLWRVTDLQNGDVDWLRGIEILEFAFPKGGNAAATQAPLVSLEIDGVSASAYRLYGAAFGRLPDLGGLGYWLEQFEKWSPKAAKPQENPYLREVAARFLELPEFRSLYPEGLTNQDFVKTLYRHVFDREAEPSGMLYWTSVLNDHDLDASKGASRADVLAYVSESEENIRRSSRLIAEGIEYIPYVPPGT